MKTQLRHAVILAAFAAFSAHAADSPSPPPSKPKPEDKSLESARAAIARQDWAGAQGILRQAVESNPANADYHNLYAYSMRKAGGADMGVVFKHYNEALRLDAKHRGAHEYIGEAYLLVGNVGKAKEHLKVLDGLCRFGCAEYSDLRKAISEFESKQASK
jgi:Flp pilus assembly protein TadD